MKSRSGQQNKFLRIITVPFRALGKARDFYINSMINCANRNFVGMQGSSQAEALPRSFSVSSARSDESSEDFRELVRAVSARTRLNSDNFNMTTTTATRRGDGPRGMPPRSISVAMGKIDEERPCCYFGEDIIYGKNVIINGKSIKNHELMYPRSKSHAVARTSF